MSLYQDVEDARHKLEKAEEALSWAFAHGSDKEQAQAKENSQGALREHIEALEEWRKYRETHPEEDD